MKWLIEIARFQIAIVSLGDPGLPWFPNFGVLAFGWFPNFSVPDLPWVPNFGVLAFGWFPNFGVPGLPRVPNFDVPVLPWFPSLPTDTVNGSVYCFQGRSGRV